MDGCLVWSKRPHGLTENLLTFFSGLLNDVTHTYRSGCLSHASFAGQCVCVTHYRSYIHMLYNDVTQLEKYV